MQKAEIINIYFVYTFFLLRKVVFKLEEKRMGIDELVCKKTFWQI